MLRKKTAYHIIKEIRIYKTFNSVVQYTIKQKINSNENQNDVNVFSVLQS